MLKFITGEPALVFGKSLIVADLHIGIEHELYKSGIKVPSQVGKMQNKIDKLIKKTGAKRLIVLGDIKHQVPGVSFQELREVPEFFNHFSEKIETHIVLGNHDSELPALVDNVQIHGTEGFRLGDIYIAHGHAWPKKEFLKCKCIILSHTHPMIEIRDKLGYRFTERVWVKACLDRKKAKIKYKNIPPKLPEIILVPAFNDFSGGGFVNREGTFSGPLTKLIDKKKSETFFLDGTSLGSLDKLKRLL